jgi:hypothetical protein
MKIKDVSLLSLPSLKPTSAHSPPHTREHIRTRGRAHRHMRWKRTPTCTCIVLIPPNHPHALSLSLSLSLCLSLSLARSLSLHPPSLSFFLSLSLSLSNPRACTHRYKGIKWSWKRWNMHTQRMVAVALYPSRYCVLPKPQTLNPKHDTATLGARGDAERMCAQGEDFC